MIPPRSRPAEQSLSFDADGVFSSVVGLRAEIAPEATTAPHLGQNRRGYGVVIEPDGLIVTTGYLILEARSIWLQLADGRTLPGDVVAYDPWSGLGLVQALGALEGIAPARIGDSAHCPIGSTVIMAGRGGLQNALQARLIARKRFAGHWEYLLEDALFTMPAHPNWGGAGLFCDSGLLLGIGSLCLPVGRVGGPPTDGEGRVGDKEADRERTAHANVVIPAHLLVPWLEDVRLGRKRAMYPWLGLYAMELDEVGVVVIGVVDQGPAQQAGIAEGDHILTVAGQPVTQLEECFDLIRQLGPAGVRVPLTLMRERRRLQCQVNSMAREDHLYRQPRH